MGTGLFLLAVGLYLNTLGHGFVFDDAALILQNPQVTEFRVAEMFSRHGYRPVRTVTYALNYALGGDDPLGYHLFNVLLHALNTLLLFLLLARWSKSPSGAAVGAAVFAAHPVQTAAVAYISGRKDLLATFFVLAGLWFYTRFRESGGWRALTASMGAFLFAVFSKEVAVVFPVLILAAEGLIFGNPGKDSPAGRLVAFLKRRWMAACAALLIAASGVWFALFVGRATRMAGYWGGSPEVNWGTSLKLFAHYLKLVFWPSPLIADYKGDVFPLSAGLSDPLTLLSGVLLVAFAGGAFWARGRLPLVSFGAFWFLAALTPVLQIVPFHELAADHFLYLPMVGVSLCATWIGVTLEKAAKPVPWAAVGAVVLLVWSGLTVSRNGDWRDSKTLWEATHAAAPGSYRANANLGRIYFDDPSSREKGLELTRRAVELDPNDPVATSNLGAMLYVTAQGAYARGEVARAKELADKAVDNLERALSSSRRDGSILSNLGNCQRMLGALSELRGDAAQARESRKKAIAYFEAALKRDRREPVKSAWYNLALVYLDEANYAKAADCLDEFIKVRPRHAGANLQAGWCRMRLGKPGEAVSYLKSAVSLAPSVESFRLLIDALQSSGQAREALAVCEQALRRFPGQGSLDLRAGLLYNDVGDHAKALERLKSAASSSDADSAAKARDWLKKLGG